MIRGIPGIRQAEARDIDAMHRVRMSVRENRLVSTVLSPARYLEYVEVRGRGWVSETDDAIVAFAVADSLDGCLWALFVEPEHEREGHGRRLHEAAVAWLFEQGHDRIWLTTSPGTRAEGFYRKSGWVVAGDAPQGEIRLELARPSRSE